MRFRMTCGLSVVSISAAGLFALAGIPVLAQRNATPDVVAKSDGSTPAMDLQRAIDHARDTVFPALVNIQVVSVSYWRGTESKDASIGSGTIISDDGLVVTNHHVVSNGRTFRVTLSDKRELSATLVGEDPLTDLAVLRLDMDEVKNSGRPLPTPASWGDSRRINVGDYVLAMGAPFGLSRSVTLGIVSNTERVFTSQSGDDIADQEFDFESSSDVFTRWIQHDALILPGNSGGPLVNLDGRIVGINTRGGSGMGFANPSELARAIADELVANGEVTRSTIGVAFKSVRRAGFDRGVLVNSVDSDGPADKAGIKAGDVLVAIDGDPVNARFAEDIPVVLRTFASKPVGTQMNVTFLREGSEQTATLITEKMTKFRGGEAALRLFGVSASEITDRMVRTRRLTTKQGAIILGVRSGGPAALAEPSISSGDVVLSVNGTRVTSLDEFVKAYEAIARTAPLPEFVTIEFDSNGRNMVTLLKPRADKREDPPRELPKAWIGVVTQPVLRELARQLGTPDAVGFRITRIYPGTIASSSLLKVGDIITQVNGDSVQPRGMQDAGMLNRKVRQLRAGDTATLTVIREGSSKEIAIELERTKLGPEEALRDTNRDFEMTVRELTYFDRDDRRWSQDTGGVLVENVESVGWAGMAGIYPGDLIQRVDTLPVIDLASYRKAMEDVAKRQPERVTFVVLRGLRTQFKFAEPNWTPVVDEAPDADKADNNKPGAAPGAVPGSQVDH